LAAAKSLPVRRLRPGLKFDMRRLKTDRIASRVTVRLSPERRLTVARGEGDTGWVETIETIPWTITRLRVTGAIESSLYDALDKAMADSFLPAGERRQLDRAVAAAGVPAAAASIPAGLERVRFPLSPAAARVAASRGRGLRGAVRYARARDGGRDRHAGGARGWWLRQRDRCATPERDPHALRPPVRVRPRAAHRRAGGAGGDDRLRRVYRPLD